MLRGKDEGLKKERSVEGEVEFPTPPSWWGVFQIQLEPCSAHTGHLM